MTNREPEHPSLRSTLIATGVAFLVASVVLVTAIMPAEYGVDPTGVGKLAGWDALAKEPEPTEPILPNATSSRELLRFNVT